MGEEAWEATTLSWGINECHCHIVNGGNPYKSNAQLQYQILIYRKMVCLENEIHPKTYHRNSNDIIYQNMRQRKEFNGKY